eukprot:PITA_06819
MEAPTLINPDYSKEFHIFSFAFSDTLATVLLQKYDEGLKHPMAFFRKTLRVAELRNIFTKFGCPHKLVTDNVAAFREKELVDMCESLGIKLVHSTPYYPQGNGLAESSNKSLIRIIKKLLEDNKRNWDSKLKYALWADRVTTKKSTGNSPFKLVYGTEAIFPI